uniref:PDZ domain-containing protein n=1 Tax=Panagrolaimus superbus TaxID=310955 RepID=A0A914XXJ5_9BILA
MKHKLSGGADRAIPPTISFLRPGFIAHRCDQLQPGERLIAVNNISVASLTHEQILTVLRSAGDLVKLEVEYNLNDPVFNKAKNAMHRCAEIILEKETGGFGFTIRGIILNLSLLKKLLSLSFEGGSYGPDHRKSRAVTITAIRPGGPAHREGRMRVGDRIVTINGTDVSSATLASVQQIVSEIDLIARFVIEYDVSLFDTVKNATGPLSIEVEKIPGAEFGVSLAICEKADPITNLQKRGVFVDHVTLASVADRCGAIHPGDEILMIDGIGLEFTTLEEAMQLLKGYCTTVKLEIIPHSQMSKDEAGRKSRRRHHHHQVNGKVIHSKGKENSKRSESCDYQPSYGMKGFEPRARSHEISNERRKTQKVHRFTSNAVEQQKMQGLSGSVPAVHQSGTPVMARSTEFSRSVYVDSGIPPSSRSTDHFTFSSFFNVVKKS